MMTKLYLYIAIGVSALMVLGVLYAVVRKSGREAERAEQAEIIRRKLNNATIADDAHNRCLADPACRVSNDGFRRD